MKTLRRFCAGCVLTLALALAAFAGEMPTGITTPPPPSSQETTQGDMSTTVTGEITTGIAGDMSAGVTATDSTTDALLNLLQSLLSLF